MRLGVVADVHGNLGALEAVLADGETQGVERWWALGDLVLFGPQPVEVLELLATLPGIEYLSGNTDRYVLTGGQPHPHAQPEDALAALLDGAADIVVGGHTHDPTDRSVRGVRALNPGSVGIPRHGDACWMVITDDGGGDLHVDRRQIAYDVDAVVSDLWQRRCPPAAFVEGLLRQQHGFGR